MRDPAALRLHCALLCATPFTLRLYADLARSPRDMGTVRGETSSLCPHSPADLAGLAVSRNPAEKPTSRCIDVGVTAPSIAATMIQDSYHRPRRQRSNNTTTTVTAMAVCVSAMSAPNIVTLFQTPVRRAANQTSAPRSTDCTRPWTRTCVTSMPIKENRPHSTTAPPARRRATTSSRRQGAGAAEQRGRARGRGVPGPLAAQTSQVPFHRPSRLALWARTPVNAQVRRHMASLSTEFS
jgi:hypothetical protein